MLGDFELGTRQLATSSSDDSSASPTGFGQAQAYIFNPNVLGQAQSDILVTTNKFAQTQAKLRAFGVQRYAQSQAFIRPRVGIGQAKAYILQPNVFGQAQAKIKTTRIYGQANAFIRPRVGLGQAKADILTFGNNKFGQAQAFIRPRVGLGQAQAQMLAFNVPRFGQAKADIKVTQQKYGQAQAKIKTTRVYGQANADILATSQAYAQAQASIQGTQAYAQAQADIFATSQAYAQAQSDILVTSQAYAQAQAYLVGTMQVYGQAQADILVTSQGYAQAQADILATSQVYAQTNADIKQTYQGCAQAQAHIKFVNRGYGQTQGYISGAFKVYAQAQGYITPQAVVVNKFAQVTALIDSPIKVHSGNSAAYLSKSAGYGQAAAFIHLNKVWAQAQADIKRFNIRQNAQATAFIINTKVSAQAQADIKRTSRGYGQARAYIPPKATGQAVAYILAFGQKRFAQVNADIKVTANRFAQAQAKIVLTSTKFAQAQAYIKSRPNGYAQAQATIHSIPNRFAQAQGYILFTQGYGQANSRIFRVNNSFAQAMAHILGNTGYAQAQALITSPYIIEDMYANAHTYTYSPNFSYVIPVDFTTYGNEPTDADAIYENSTNGTWVNRYSADAPDGWLYFTLTVTSHVRIDTLKQLFYSLDDRDPDTVLEIWTGASGPGNWIPVISDDDTDFPDATTYQSLIETVLNAGTYLLQVGEWAGSIKTFNLNINVTRPQGYGSTQAFIRNTHPTKFAQSQADIKNIARVYGQAQSLIIKAQGYAQSVAYIITDRHKVAQSQATIIGFNSQSGQAQAFIAYKSAQAQAQAIISIKNRGYGQVQGNITNTKPTGQAKAFILSQRYLALYNDLQFPGYVQQESIDSSMNIKNFASYQDISFTEYQGLENKSLSMRILVKGENYLDCKNQINLAATIMRSNRKDFAPLYVHYYDRHYDALAKDLKLEADVSNVFTAQYSLEFECKPWIVSDTITTISGTTLLQTQNRTIDNGGWTPATLRFSGNNVTVSGYTSTGDFTGFVSVSGIVSNFIINSEIYESTDNSVILNTDYQIYIGPGTTSFEVTGATDCQIEYHDRWYL